MNNDVLECKRRARELVASDSAPLNRNGRKKGNIAVMKQLWEEKGYGHLALKGHNLCAQASRLEKCQEGLADDSRVNGATVMSIDESILPSGYSDTVVVEGNRILRAKLILALREKMQIKRRQIYIRPQCNSRRSCSLINRSVKGYLTRCRDHFANAIRFTRLLHLSGAKMMKEDQ